MSATYGIVEILLIKLALNGIIVEIIEFTARKYS